MTGFLNSFIRSALVGLLCTAGIFSWAPAVQAESPEEISAELKEMRRTLQELQSTVQAQNDLIQAQQRRIDDLENKLAAQPPSAQPAQQPPGSVPALAPPADSFGRGLKQYLPDIGAVADVTAKLTQGKDDAEGNDKISLRELELIVGHDIDPFSRFDSTITFSDFEDVSVEEAYITHWGIPGEVKARIGRIRPKVGKASPVHRDQLDTEDEPLVVQRYLGAEGLSRSGLELSRFLPGFFDPLTQEVIAGVMEGGVGEGGTMFGGTRRRPSFYARLKNFWEFSEDSNFELGTTWLGGSGGDNSSLDVNALGLDATLVHYVTPNNKLKWQNEIYLQNRTKAFIIEPDAVTGEGVRTDFARHPLGFYSLVDYRLSPRFGIGARGDYVQPVNAPSSNPRHAETAGAGYLTFYQSEFARWRLQAQHVELAEGGQDNRFTLQGTVAIGNHQHQLQ